MNRKLLIIALILISFVSFVFAANSDTATLTIKGYKNEDLPSDSTLRVYVYNTISGQSSTTAVDKKIDITDYLSSYLSFKDIFSIKLQTNMNKTIKISIAVSPFTNQDDKTDVISTSYYLTTKAGSYDSSSSYYSSGSYYYKHEASFSVSPSDFENSSTGCSVGSEGSSKSASVALEEAIKSSRKKKRDSESEWSTYSPTRNVLDGMSSSTIDSMIYVKMKLNVTSLDNINANVQYLAPVTITVSTE